MSSEGFRNVPGLPDGWELVHANRRAVKGEHYISDGNVEVQKMSESVFAHPIIRKIEQPAKYRPFANGKEVHPFWDVALRVANAISESKESRFRINTIGHDGVTIGNRFYTYSEAFDRFYVDDDGTPFGVKIDG